MQYERTQRCCQMFKCIPPQKSIFHLNQCLFPVYILNVNHFYAYFLTVYTNFHTNNIEECREAFIFQSPLKLLPCSSQMLRAICMHMWNPENPQVCHRRPPAAAVSKNWHVRRVLASESEREALALETEDWKQCFQNWVLSKHPIF